MPSNYPLLIMYIRFGLAHAMCVTAFYIGCLAMLMLPKWHPSRTYLRGRMGEGRKRLTTALGSDAVHAACEKGERAAA